ncbi:hypothetical protein FDECE_2628 [Fusarium decemcellulare]|nr:hypothetical protein FDECE_2628 [Fusarium decemcellulare]
MLSHSNNNFMYLKDKKDGLCCLQPLVSHKKIKTRLVYYEEWAEGVAETEYERRVNAYKVNIKNFAVTYLTDNGYSDGHQTSDGSPKIADQVGMAIAPEAQLMSLITSQVALWGQSGSKEFLIQVKNSVIKAMGTVKFSSRVPDEVDAQMGLLRLVLECRGTLSQKAASEASIAYKKPLARCREDL